MFVLFANFIPVEIILHVFFVGMTNFKVLRKDFILVSPALSLKGNISKYLFYLVLAII